MHRFWKTVTLPLFEAIGAHRVMEIGSQSGAGTRKLIEYCRTHDARCHIVDPFRPPGYVELEPELATVGKFHEALSINVLPDIEPCDAYLIDGDHNFYTVRKELEIIHDVTSNKAASSASSHGPLFLLHDVCWPYGRRDMYYQPSNIPPDHRNLWARLGLDLDKDELVDHGGMNQHLAQALCAGGNSNGVRTAAESFVSDHGKQYRFYVIPILHGLGIIIPSKDEQQPYGKIVRELCETTDRQRNLLELAERDRLKLLVKLSSIHGDTAKPIA
ncbi:MAG: hypothetical protein A2289_15975 [Deltaproteobacteria bacterium RIFOXYA12_FULL_58_15]|nr:MAG: hypothetical protein A2289_15975 [Deltaproteobacteria bacterium RIFOXYA12_FULL_58_15]OGR12957.1 MAG: hypothetical protein A2341_04265 [Deltaproteobacteria bacterium RIFOXYB12_FULL_58_9]